MTGWTGPLPSDSSTSRSRSQSASSGSMPGARPAAGDDVGIDDVTARGDAPTASANSWASATRSLRRYPSRPRRRPPAGRVVGSSTYCESTRTRGPREFRADRPVRRGSLVGLRRRHADVVIATSGRSPRDRGQQLLGVARLGHDIEPAASSRRTMPARSSTESSATTTRIASERAAPSSGARPSRRGLAREGAGRLRPLAAVLGERALQRLVQRRRQVRARGEQRRRRVAQVGQHLLEIALAVERRRAGERLVEHACGGRRRRRARRPGRRAPARGAM